MTISRWILLRMTNVTNKSCRENQHTHFMAKNFYLPKTVPFIRCRKMWWSQRGCKITICQRVACWINTATRPRQCTRTHTHTHSHACTQTYSPTRARTHRELYNTYCFCTATMVSWMRLIVTSHYTAYVVLIPLSLLQIIVDMLMFIIHTPRTRIMAEHSIVIVNLPSHRKQKIQPLYAGVTCPSNCTLNKRVKCGHAGFQDVLLLL